MNQPVSPKNKKTARVFQDLNTPWKMWFYFFQKLPSILWFDIRVKYVSEEKAAVTLPFRWRSQNPFRSIYFAAQCAAAELSTGLLAVAFIQSQPQKVSMLVTRFEMEFLKKATLKTTFQCAEGEAIRKAIENAISTGEGQEIEVVSEGIQEDGTVVSRARLQWSFKLKSANP